MKLGESIEAVKKINGLHDIDGLFSQAGVDPRELYEELWAIWPTATSGQFAAGFVAGCLYRQGGDEERVID